jgi:hypothetical protein
MGVTITVDKISAKRTSAKFRLMEKLYPEEVFRAIVEILFDIKLISQKKLKSDNHIVTSRLRNSIFVKTPKQKFAKKSTNSKVYSYPGGKDKRTGRMIPGGTATRELDVSLNGAEGAVGTNVVYASKIEKLDSFLQHSVDTVDSEKRFKQAALRAEKRARKK